MKKLITNYGIILFTLFNIVLANISNAQGNQQTNYGKYAGNTPVYIINISAIESEKLAQEAVAKLIKEGYNAGYLWIPDYASLSGAKYFCVFIGPFLTQNKCEMAVEEYRKVNSSVYGLLVSQENKRVEIRGIGKVTVKNIELTPKIGEEKELLVKFTNIQHGDMSTYIMFEPVNSAEGSNEMSFANWTWAPDKVSANSEMESFNESLFGSKYKIKIKYSTLKELEYKGFEIGNVETGELYNDWVLVRIEVVK